MMNHNDVPNIAAGSEAESKENPPPPRELFGDCLLHNSLRVSPQSLTLKILTHEIVNIHPERTPLPILILANHATSKNGGTGRRGFGL